MDLRLAGLPADQIGSVTNLAWSTRYGHEGACGMYDATWTMDLDPGYDHPALRRGARVEVMDSMVRKGSTLILGQPERGVRGEPWRFTAAGVGREAERDNGYYCLDALGNMTSRCDVAIDRAIDRGLPWAGRDSSIPTTPLTDSADEPNVVGALLNSASDEEGKCWGVGRDDIVRFITAPTTPDWHLDEGAAVLSPADDEYASTVLLRYRTTTGGYDTKTADGDAVEEKFGHREFLADATPLGPISGTRAQNLANGILAKSKGRMGFSSGFTLAEGQVTTPGGGPVDLSLIEAGQMLRMWGQLDELLPFTGRAFMDVILSEVRQEDRARVIQVAPIGLVDRRLAAVLESALRKAA